jgi:NADH dehydrogenase (ubiquinone) Fe-S protein 3
MKKYNYMTQNFAKFLIKMVPKWIQYHVSHKNETILYIYPEYLTSFLFFLRVHTNTQYKVLIDVTAIDYPSRALRFEVVYNLLSIEYNSRIRIKTCIDEITPLNSSTELYSAAGWWEREAWDMFGIFFSGHPDLRRILTDYGFEGHPLRKDFPLTGYTEVRYDDSEKRVITESLELTQEFRYFDFSSPWEQIEKSK